MSAPIQLLLLLVMLWLLSLFVCINVVIDGYVLDCSELERNKLRVLEGLVFQGLESLLSLKLKRNAMSDLMDGTFWGLGKILSL